MSDYVVRLVGKDDLSSTVSNVKKELSDVGKVGKDAMSKIDDKFQRIITSSAPLKRQLRDLQAIMADMNLKGLSNTDEFTKIAIEAGKIKDALSDASTAVKNFSNDTMGLQASIQALQGIAAAANVAVGAMALFGNENEDAVKAIKKVQGALALLNGVQQLANVLNKDSILILKAKQIQQAFNAASTIKQNVATAANTAAVAANTAVQRVATATQKAWNVTTAVSKALLGDISGLILIGAAAYTTYSLATAKSKSKQDELNNTQSHTTTLLQKQIEARKEATKEIDSEKNKINALYSVLTNVNVAYKDKARALEELKNIIPSVNGYINSEAVYHGNAVTEIRKHIDALDDLQKALAAFKLGQKIQEEVTNSEFEKFQADEKVYRKENNIKADEAEMNRHTNDAGYTWQGGRSQAYIDARNRKEINEENLETAKKEQKAADLRVKNAKQQQKDYQRFRAANGGSAKAQAAVALSNGDANKAADIYFNRDITGSRTSRPTKNTPPPKIDDAPKYAKDSLTDLETQLRDLQQNLKDGLIPSDKVEETKVTIERLKEDILKKKIEIGLEVDPILKNNEELKNKLLEQVSSFFSSNSNIETQPQLSSFEKATGQNPFGTDTLNGIESLMNYNDTLIGKLEETRNKLLELQDALVNAGLEGTEQFAAVAKELENVNGTISTVTISQETLANKAVEAAEAQKKQEEFITTLNDISDAAANTGEIFKSLGQISDDETLNAAGIIAEAIANIIQGYATASVQAAETGNPWIWAAFSLAGLAQVASVIAQIHNLSGYAEGGIIGGGSRHGDAILGRLNAGEMVLNTRQQSNLFKALDNGNFESVYGGDSQRVDFRIKGQDLYGTLKNFSKTAAKSGKITGIQ